MASGLDQTMIDPVGGFSNVDEELPPAVPAAVAAPGSVVASPESDLREGTTAGFDNHNFSCQIQAGNQTASVQRYPAGFRSCPSHQNLDNSQIAVHQNFADRQIAGPVVPPYPSDSQIVDFPTRVCWRNPAGWQSLAGYCMRTGKERNSLTPVVEEVAGNQVKSPGSTRCSYPCPGPAGNNALH